MPIFKFHVYDGRSDVQPDEIELPTIDSARREGIRRAGATLVLDAPILAPDTQWRLEVSDASDLLLFRMDFAITASAALR